MALIFILPSNQMRRISSPTSHPHHCCRQSQWIESLAFTNLTRCKEHYRRHHWFTATSYDLLLSHCQRSLLPLPPSDNNEDGEDNNDDNDDDEENNSEDDNKDDADKDEDDSDDDNDNEGSVSKPVVLSLHRYPHKIPNFISKNLL